MDNIVIKKKNKPINKTMKNTTNKTGKSKNLKTQMVEMFLDMLNTVKLYHWKTYVYAKHEATDELYQELNKYIDMFMEVLMGKDETRIPNGSIRLDLKNTSSDQEYKNKIYGYRTFLQNMEKMGVHDTDLLNIRDEILGKLNQFLYLLTFK